MNNLLLTALLTFVPISFAQGQILISILLGDKLNSEKLEFGLVGGAAITNITAIPEAKASTRLHLGFYFDFMLKDQLSIYTGVIAKSSLGAKSIAPYPVGEETLDPILVTGSVRRNLSYFSIPVFFKYKLHKLFFVEGGPQISLLHKAKDEFVTTIKKDDDLTYIYGIMNQYKKIDFGITAGMGYKLMQGKGISVGVRYYTGLVNILKENTGKAQRNTAFYFFAGIPIGGVKDKNTIE